MYTTALLLLLSIVVLISVIVYLLFYPTVNPVPVPQNKPYPVMPGYGPYWSHGGQANSGLLY
jgi:hypothetical protein